jgi:NiFe hydrogenase small subunit HydA
MAALLGLSELWIPRIAQALEKAIKKPSVIWLNFSSDTGCTESFIKSECPSVAEIVLNMISLDFNETIMAAAGENAEEILETYTKRGGYICVIEGAIPTKHGFGRIGGKEMIEIALKVTSRASRVIAVGSCASFGGIPAAHPNPSEAKSVESALGIDVVNLPGCPVNPEWVLSTIVNILMLGRCPELDEYKRPKNIYGSRIHDNCERRAHFDAGRFVDNFGDEGSSLNYCLYKMGCKGPETHSNCPLVKWNAGTNWCVQAGAPCIGCVEPNFWDNFAPFYERLPGIKIPGITGVEVTADRVGAALGIATAVGIGAHLVGSIIRGKKKKNEGEEDKE